MSAPLPVLVSIPHGSTGVPPEVVPHIVIGPEEVWADIDPFTAQIYDVGTEVRHVVQAEVARTFVDLNRSEDDRPPDNPDGVVKTQTCVGPRIFARPDMPSDELTEQLLERYHRPYHRRLAELVGDGGVSLALDCHSMSPHPPAIAPDPDQRPRPALCLSNAHGATAPDDLLATLGRALGDALGLEDGDVAFNEPFAGGWITRHHGSGDVPWIQIEMNRNLYLRPPWYDDADRSLAPERIHELRAAFLSALQEVSEHIRQP